MRLDQGLQILCCILLASVLSACVMQKSPAPVYQLNSRYSQIDRGSYKGSTYKVKSGETLSFISYITGKSIDNIVKYNKLSNPNTIYPGQTLRLTAPVVVKSKKRWQVTPTTTTTTKKTSVVAKKKTEPKKLASKKVVKSTTTAKKSTAKSKSSSTTKTTYAKVSKWRWPTKGKIVQRYSSVKGNKGVNIAGKKGQPIYATAAGKVVYAGNALRGYGNIILIKHNSNYMSAYAHNDSLLVKENQQVKAGQKIALMGKTSSPIVQLHFEIRYKGKSVDPLRYLP